MAKKAMDYLFNEGKEKDKKKFIHIRVPESLLGEIEKGLKGKKVIWTQIVVACLKQFRDELVEKKKK